MTRSRHVLVLDDDEFMLQLLDRMLRSQGLRQVSLCRAGHEAIAHVVSATPPVDVILLDINMPEMDGIEFLRQLAAARYTGDVLLVSGESGRTINSMGRLVREQGMRLLGALPKPPDKATLRRLLGQAGASSAAGAARPAAVVTPALLAAALDAGEIVNYYQPQILLGSGKLLGAECLARWVQADGTVLGPEHFVTMAEECGLIGRMTQQVLRGAARQMRAWEDAGIALRMSVNVSMADISALDFPDTAVALLAEQGVEPRRITLEVTESRVARHLGTVLDVLSRLRLKRFHLSIDDFGTGHSSLTQLRDLPFDELKIDRGFVDGVATEARQLAICEATLRMARQLRMNVVAEGIERQADLDLLRDLGCNAGQGFLFARPAPADVFNLWLQRDCAIAPWNDAARRGRTA